MFVTPTECGLLSPHLPPSSSWSPRATSTSLPTGRPPRLSYGCYHWLVLKKESQSCDWNNTYLLPRPNEPIDFQVFKKGRAPLHRGGRRWAAKPDSQGNIWCCRCYSQLSSLDTSPTQSHSTGLSLLIFPSTPQISISFVFQNSYTIHKSKWNSGHCKAAVTPSSFKWAE